MWLSNSLNSSSGHHGIQITFKRYIYILEIILHNGWLHRPPEFVSLSAHMVCLELIDQFSSCINCSTKESESREQVVESVWKKMNLFFFIFLILFGKRNDEMTVNRMLNKKKIADFLSSVGIKHSVYSLKRIDQFARLKPHFKSRSFYSGVRWNHPSESISTLAFLERGALVLFCKQLKYLSILRFYNS